MQEEGQGEMADVVQGIVRKVVEEVGEAMADAEGAAATVVDEEEEEEVMTSGLGNPLAGLEDSLSRTLLQPTTPEGVKTLGDSQAEPPSAEPCVADATANAMEEVTAEVVEEEGVKTSDALASKEAGGDCLRRPGDGGDCLPEAGGDSRVPALSTPGSESAMSGSRCLALSTLALNSKPSTINPQPSTLNPQPSTRNPQPSTLDPQPPTLTPRSSTLDPQPSTLNPQPSTLDPQL